MKISNLFSILSTKPKKGFTLLETLTSIAIISFVIIGPLAVIIASSSYAKQTKDTMIATFLAEESIELLQNQYDSLVVFCKKKPSDALCAPSATVPGETGSQIAWRLFKDRFSQNTGVSCYKTENPNGCSFDYMNMIDDPTVTPTRYSAESSQCSTLTEVTKDITVASSGTGGNGTTYTHVKRKMYVCKGVTAHLESSPTSGTSFSRSVIMEQLPTFETGPVSDQYNDDLRITANITFKGVNGLFHTVSVTRLIHARG